MSEVQYAAAAEAPSPARSGAVTAAAVLLVIVSIASTGFGVLLLISAAAMDSTGGMEDLGIAIAATVALILLPIGLIGLVLAWRLFRRGAVARIVAIVVCGLVGLAALALVAADLIGGRPQPRAVVGSVVTAAWYLLIVGLLLVPSAGRDFAAARARR